MSFIHIIILNKKSNFIFKYSLETLIIYYFKLKEATKLEEYN